MCGPMEPCWDREQAPFQRRFLSLIEEIDKAQVDQLVPGGLPERPPPGGAKNWPTTNPTTKAEDHAEGDPVGVEFNPRLWRQTWQ